MYESNGCLGILIVVAGIAGIMLLACAIDWYGCDSRRRHRNWSTSGDPSRDAS